MPKASDATSEYNMLRADCLTIPRGEDVQVKVDIYVLYHQPSYLKLFSQCGCRHP